MSIDIVILYAQLQTIYKHTRAHIYCIMPQCRNVELSVRVCVCAIIVYRVSNMCYNIINLIYLTRSIEHLQLYSTYIYAYASVFVHHIMYRWFCAYALNI